MASQKFPKGLEDKIIQLGQTDVPLNVVYAESAQQVAAAESFMKDKGINNVHVVIDLPNFYKRQQLG